MSYDSDLNRVRKRAEEQGWRYRRTENNHHQFYSPDKETIVTAAGTPSDQRGWLNFLADMRRGGYRDDFHGLETLGTLGQALAEAKEKAEQSQPTTNKAEPVVGKPRSLSVAAHVRSIFRNHPERTFSVEEVQSMVQAVVKDVTRGTVSQGIKYMHDNGQLTRVGHSRSGMYKLSRSEKTAVENTTPPTPTPTAEAAEAPVKPGGVIGSMTGDAAIDEDLKVMDSALVALGQIEEVVKRNRERLFALAQFKKLLGG